MPQPKISVIVPTLNEARYIGATLRAVKNQDYNKPFEIIVADARSKDKTREIAKKYTNKVITTKYGGVGHGRNRGADVAKGEILVFLDADTIPQDNLLKTVDKTFRKRKIIAASCWIIPLSPRLRDFLIYSFFNNFVRTSFKLRKPQMGGMCFVVRKRAFEQAGGFHEGIFITEDLELAMRLKKFGKSAFMKDTLVLTSPRRLQRWGLYKSAAVYVANYLRVLAQKKSFKKFKPVR